MITLLFVLMVLAPAQQTEISAGVLHEVEITIVLEESYASVASSYIIDRNGDSLVFRALRVPRQIVLVDGAFGPDYELEPIHMVEERRLLAPPGQSGAALFRLRYKVEGDFSRLPLFIPNTETAAGVAIGITVVNAAAGAIDDASLPFQPVSESAHFASVDAIPETVFIPADQGFSAPRAAVLVAALVLAAAAAIYALYRRHKTQ